MISDKQQAYLQFLHRKVITAPLSGFVVTDDDLHPRHKGHQRAYIRWALSGGRRLIPASFGLGKTSIEIEIARQVYLRTGKKFLTVCPLGVKHQFTEEDGPALGVEWQYVRTDAEVEAATTPFLITNFERVRDGDIDPRQHDLGGVSLDEGDVMRSLGSKTYQIFKDVFADVPFRYVATATPCPNEYREIIYYAEFLGIMDKGQALTRWFKRDSSRAGHLTIHPQHEEEFWLWVASWALFCFYPSDLGFSDEGYVLPKLNVHWHRLAVDQTRAFAQKDNYGQHRMFLDAAAGVTEACAEKRATLPDRIIKMQELLQDNPDRHWLIWHHLEDERRAIEQAVPTAVSVYGSQDLDERESRILGFVRGSIPILATKPEIAGSGCNFQRHCYSNIFLGVNYQFKDFIQSVHRTYRFQQAHEVDVHVIYAESEDAVVAALRRKWEQHNALVDRMRDIVKTYGLVHEALKSDLSRAIGVTREEVKGQCFTAVRNDCVLETMDMPDNSVGMVLTSIPFGNHYEYTDQYEDFGHNPTDDDFWAQMDFLIPELLRVTMPGRIAAIHVKDRQLYGHQTASGFMETDPFSDDCVRAFRKHGWMYQGRRTIVTDVVRENASTYRLGWTEMTKDASKMSSGLPEYLLLFRKAPTSAENSRADEPVTKRKDDYTRARWQIDAHSHWNSNGNTPLLPYELYDYAAHVGRLEDLDRIGRLPSSWMYEPPKSHHPMVWDDIIYMRTLNSSQAQKRRENHICPLPFDIVERAILLYSNPGDLIYEPFAGLFTVPYKAIELGRYGYGSELNAEYFKCGVGYCQAMEERVSAPKLFDYIAECCAPASQTTAV